MKFNRQGLQEMTDFLREKTPSRIVPGEILSKNDSAMSGMLDDSALRMQKEE